MIVEDPFLSVNFLFSRRIVNHMTKRAILINGKLSNFFYFTERLKPSWLPHAVLHAFVASKRVLKVIEKDEIVWSTIRRSWV